MGRRSWGVLLAFAFLAATAAGLFAARRGRHRALLAALPPISLEQFGPSARPLIAEMLDRVRDAPLAAESWGELGFALSGNSASTEGLACFRRAQELDPNDARWVHLTAASALATPQRPAGIAGLRRALTLDPTSTPTAALLAEAYLEDGDAAAAASLLRPLVEKERTAEPRLYFDLARAEAELGATARAIELAKFVARQTRRRKVHFLLAQLYRRAGDLDDAQRHERLLALFPAGEDPPWGDAIAAQVGIYARSVDVLAQRAREATARGSPDEAIRILEQLAPEDRAASQATATMAIALARLGRFKEAESLLASAPATDPNILFASGLVAARQGKYAEGADLFARAASAENRSGNAVSADSADFNRGQCLESLHQTDAAAVAYRVSLKTNPGNIDALLRLANLSLQQGRKAEAAPLLADAALLEPDNPTVKNLLQRAAK